MRDLIDSTSGVPGKPPSRCAACDGISPHHRIGCSYVERFRLTRDVSTIDPANMSDADLLRDHIESEVNDEARNLFADDGY